MENSVKSGAHRKLYETLVSSKSGVDTKKEAVLSIIRLALTDHSHFSFLLNQINWFSPSNKPLLPLLPKILRLYRGTCREAPRVAYNLLSEGLVISDVNIAVVDILSQTLENAQDHPVLLDCLRENYPHKVCPSSQHTAYLDSLLALTMKLPTYRFEILEIIIQNLTYFDTEMQVGEEYTNHFSPEDGRILALIN